MDSKPRGRAPGRGAWAVALVTVSAALAAAALGAGLAAGERAQGGNVIVSFNADFSPSKLPRTRFVPARVRLRSDFDTADGTLIPQLRGLTIDLSRRGKLFTKGLPRCPIERLEPGFPSRALAACGKALVGHGHVAVIVALPGQAPFPFKASLFAFNGETSGGRQAVLVLAYGPKPSASFVLPFVIHHGRGDLGTKITMSLSKEAASWAHLVHFDIELRRRYAYRGERRSFINAECPLPRGFTGGLSPFARATYRFAGGQRVTTVIVRGCRVAGGG